jgi:benzoyl-CoA reductase/2-hydroxyglutaryl-CoA dehydratase subunit BcrC/BadD/HgdB
MQTQISSEAFRRFVDASEAIMNPEIQAWKERGGRVIGFFCSAVPEELFSAAGLLPFRMRGTGSKSTELSDAYFSSINCSFPRHTFNQALLGEFDFLDGLVCINSCDHVRRIYDNWKRALKTPFVQVMSLPRKIEEPQVEWYDEELRLLKGQLEEHFEVEIDDERIRAAIRLHNEVRALQKRLYELRRADRPPITGTETLAVMVAGTAMPKQRYKELLEELLEELIVSEGCGEYRARLMIVGGELDDPEYIRIIEEQGGLVVADSTCFGSRLMWEPVDEAASDPIRALARYYIQERPSCPRMYGDQPRRIDYTRSLAREYKVDGIIGERLLFCDQWLVEHYMTTLDLGKDGIPFMVLDREYVLSGQGQIRTRVQAFIETLEGMRNQA